MKTAKKPVHAPGAFFSHRAKNARSPARKAAKPPPPQKTPDAQTEIEKAFALYLGANSEDTEDTLARYIARITK